MHKSYLLLIYDQYNLESDEKYLRLVDEYPRIWNYGEGYSISFSDYIKDRELKELVKELDLLITGSSQDNYYLDKRNGFYQWDNLDVIQIQKIINYFSKAMKYHIEWITGEEKDVADDV